MPRQDLAASSAELKDSDLLAVTGHSQVGLLLAHQSQVQDLLVVAHKLGPGPERIKHVGYMAQNIIRRNNRGLS